MIIARRSSEGVSVLTMWLSFVCASLTFVNAFMLDWDGIQCCRYLVRSPPRAKASFNSTQSVIWCVPAADCWPDLPAAASARAVVRGTLLPVLPVRPLCAERCVCVCVCVLLMQQRLYVYAQVHLHRVLLRHDTYEQRLDRPQVRGQGARFTSSCNVHACAVTVGNDVLLTATLACAV